MIKEYVRDLRKEFKGYSGKSLRLDLMAGLTVAAVALPLALAFGVSSGADAAAGLITAIISAFLIGALSGASFQISGPTGAMSAILLPLAAKHGFGSVLIAGLMAGGILLIAGLLRLGKLVYFLPSPVIAGFTSGIAVIIALGQLDNLLGIRTQGETAVEHVIHMFRHGVSPNTAALLMGLAVIAFTFLWPKKWGARLPAALIAIIAATAATALFNLPVAVVGGIPQALVHSQRVDVEALQAAQWTSLIMPAVSIAALCMIESLLCGVAAGRMKGERLRGNRELIAQGIGNIVLPFLGGVPATSAIARTSVAIKSGQQTRLTGIFHGVALLLSMLLLSPFMSRIPLCALAGILVATAWRMNEWANIRYIFGRRFKGAALKFLITMVVTVVFDLTIAIAAGVLFSILYFVVKISNLDVNISEIDPDRLGSDADIPDGVQVIYVTGPVFFGSLESLTSGLDHARGSVLIFSMRGVPLVDTSGVQAILEFCEKKHAYGTSVLFSSLQPGVRNSLDRAGITEFVGAHAFFDNARDAIEHACARDSAKAQ